jgi:hypothetical protein
LGDIAQQFVVQLALAVFADRLGVESGDLVVGVVPELVAVFVDHLGELDRLEVAADGQRSVTQRRLGRGGVVEVVQLLAARHGAHDGPLDELGGQSDLGDQVEGLAVGR